MFISAFKMIDMFCCQAFFHTTFTRPMSNYVSLRPERSIMPVGEREGIMECICKQQANIESTRERIYVLLTQCIADIRKTVASSGLEMQDIGSETKNSRLAWIISSMI